jgi:hypothetical protein
MRHLSIFLVIVSGLLLAWNFYEYFLYSGKSAQNHERAAFRTLQTVSDKIDTVVLTVSRAAHNLVEEIEAAALMEQDLRYLMSHEADSFPFIKMVKVAFEPYQFDSDKELFGLNYSRQAGSFDLLDTNYWDSAVSSSRWYTDTRVQHSSVLSWSYPGEGQSGLLNYSQPVFWREGAGVQFIGAVDITFSLENLNVPTDPVLDHSRAKIYLFDSLGNLILPVSLQEKQRNPQVDIPGLSGRSKSFLYGNTTGRLVLDQPDNDLITTLFFETSEQTGWKISLITTELSNNAAVAIMEEKRVNLYLSGGLFLLLSVLFIYNFFREKR